MALIGLCWLLIVNTRDWRSVIGFLFVFILLSGVEIINPFNSVYIKTDLISHQFIFNNVISTVTEASKTPFSEILYRNDRFCIMGILSVWYDFLGN